MKLRLGLLALAACRAHAIAPLPPLPPAGVSISVYDGYALVDDRRSVTVTGTTLELDHVDPGASLASLTIESDLRVGACHRDRDPAGSIVRCDVTGAPGRHLVRLLYVSSALHVRAEHDIAVTGERATVTSRFQIETPAWGGGAELSLFDGGPDHVPREIARAKVALDGRIAVLASAPRDIPATLRRIYDGAMLGDAPPTDASWGHESQPVVWVWLELEGVALAPAPTRVHAEGRDAGVPADALRTTGATLRMPLWKDDELRGSRQRFVDLGTGAALAERVVLGVTNSSAAPREVWAVEHLRPARRHRIEHAWPAPPVTVGDVVRAKLVIQPGATERTGFTLAYDY